MIESFEKVLVFMSFIFLFLCAIVAILSASLVIRNMVISMM